MIRKFKNKLLFRLIAFLMTAFLSAPCFATELIRGDKAFAGKVTFLQNVLAKKSLAVEGSLDAVQFSERFFVCNRSGANGDRRTPSRV